MLHSTIIYPPTLTGEVEVRLADWTPNIDIYHEDSCPLYVLHTESDIFGCESILPGTYEVFLNYLK